jgi:hypothetical protein
LKLKIFKSEDKTYGLLININGAFISFSNSFFQNNKVMTQ